MKTSLLLQLTAAALSTAFVIPDEQILNLNHVQIEPRPATSVLDRLPSKAKIIDKIDRTFDRISDELEETVEQGKHALDEAIDYATAQSKDVSNKIHETYFDAQGWLDSAVEDAQENFDELDIFGGGDHPPHHGHDDRPHHRPGHGHHGKPNMTVYQLIASSKYTKKLAKAIDEYDDLVKALNSTSANYTVFAPNDHAFEKIKHGPKLSKEDLKKVLSYHVSPEFYPAGRILVTRTIPTLLKSSSLGKKPLPQRLSTNIGFRGLTVNFYSRIVAVNIFGTNGVIHAVDSIIVPPRSVLEIVDSLPATFSTLELGLGKTGLLEELNNTKHAGGTFFAPSNFAFQKLGTRINSFLFSSNGRKYLKALLEYHVVADQTLYSDAYYKASSTDMEESDHGRIPKGLFHVDLPTLLKDKHLSIDIARYGRWIEIKINGFARVDFSDVVAEDGVIHVVGNVLIPPKKLGEGNMEVWDGKTELTEEELVARLEPYLSNDDL